MKKIKIALNAVRIAFNAVWQLIVTFYQFTCILCKKIWDVKVNFPLVLILLIFSENVYMSYFKYSKAEYNSGIVSAYNIGYEAGIDKALQAYTPPSDTALVYDKPNGNVIDTILIPGK